MSPLTVVTLSIPPATVYFVASSRTIELNLVLSTLAPSKSSPEPDVQVHGWSGSSPSSVNESNDTVSPWPSACGPNANTPNDGAVIGFATVPAGVHVVPSREYSPV